MFIVIFALFGMEITENSAICALLFVIFILNDVQITIFYVKITPTKFYLCRFNGVLLIFSGGTKIVILISIGIGIK